MEYADYLCRTMDNGEYYVKSMIYGRNIAASTRGPTARNNVYTGNYLELYENLVWPARPFPPLLFYYAEVDGHLSIAHGNNE